MTGRGTPTAVAEQYQAGPRIVTRGFEVHAGGVLREEHDIAEGNPRPDLEEAVAGFGGVGEHVGERDAGDGGREQGKTGVGIRRDDDRGGTKSGAGLPSRFAGPRERSGCDEGCEERSLPRQRVFPRRRDTGVALNGGLGVHRTPNRLDWGFHT